MKLTIANKKLLSKPVTNLDKAKYFKNIKFKTGNFKIDTFKKVISNGYTLTYLFKDEEFERDNHYMSNNYYGTQFICVDIDSCEINPIEFVESIKFKPTLLHTTFSNLTPQKGSKWCFHLFYVFDEVIIGENNFDLVFQKITDDYSDYVDKCAKDCHRCIFTSNPTLPNYIFKDYGIIYSVNDFLPKTQSEEFDDIDTFFNENSNGKKIQSANILTTINNIQGNDNNFPKEKKNEIKSNDWNLDKDFWEDLNTMQRGTFLNKYLEIYPIINRTLPTNEQIVYLNGIIYENWKGYNYYEVPSKYRYIKSSGKRQVVKVQNGNRTKSLMFDCLCFIKCNPNITKEWLVTMLVNEVYRYYDNSDKEFNNYKILGIAKYGWNMKDSINIEPLKKSFKIQVSTEMSKNKAVGLINKLNKDEEIGNLIDLSISLEENIKVFKENGVKITKQRLVQFCNDYQIEILSDKQLRDKAVIDCWEKNNKPSSRKMEELLKEQGIKISYKTIQSIINKNKIGK